LLDVRLGLVKLFDRHSLVIFVGDHPVESDLAEHWVISQANFLLTGRNLLPLGETLSLGVPPEDHLAIFPHLGGPFGLVAVNRVLDVLAQLGLGPPHVPSIGHRFLTAGYRDTIFFRLDRNYAASSSNSPCGAKPGSHSGS
jgi:hypothetical protein